MFRIFRYGRTLDIETINVLLDDGLPKYYNFSAHQPPIIKASLQVQLENQRQTAASNAANLKVQKETLVNALSSGQAQ